MQKETRVLEELTNQKQVNIQQRKQLKEEKRTVARREKSVRDESTLQFFEKTFNLHFMKQGSMDDQKVMGVVKGEQITPFAFDTSQMTTKEIADKLWDIVDCT